LTEAEERWRDRTDALTVTGIVVEVAKVYVAMKRFVAFVARRGAFVANVSIAILSVWEVL
jgi:hypothetical protein